MKMKLFLASFVAMGFYSNTFAAGGVDGGGGKGVVCRDVNGVIKSAELLDLYEGTIQWSLNIRKSSEPMADQIKNALALIPPSSRGRIEFYVNLVQNNMKLTPPGTELIPIDDSFEVVLPRGCKAEQLANYYNNKLILVSSDIWTSLGETDRAALILHEAVYAGNRIFGATNSRQSRHVVARIFDPSTQWVDIKDQVPQNALNCTSTTGGLFMWAYQAQSNGWVLQFQILGQSFVMSKKWVTVEHEAFDFKEAKTFPILPGEDLIGTGVTSYILAKSAFEDGDIITIAKRWEPIRDYSTGQIIRGYQTPRYYLKWTSGTYPNSSTEDLFINCSLTIP